MAPSHRSASLKSELPCERAIQLRSEAVAAMRLRYASATRCSAGMRTAMAAELPREARQARILVVSDYDGLRTSREQVLRLEGFQVQSVSSRTILDSAWMSSFDIVILCQSLEFARAARIAVHLRRASPGIALLRINPSQTGAEPGSLFDFELDSLAGPRGLLRAIEAIGQRTGSD